MIRTLADGSVKTYVYERKPRAVRRHSGGALREIFNRYSVSPEFKRLVPHWQRQKLWLMRKIETELGWMGFGDLESRRARTEFYAMRDRHMDKPRRADFMIQALSSALQWAYDRGIVEVNHATRIEKLSPNAPRAEKFYSEEQENLLLERLAPDLANLFRFALYTGLRRSDICSLTSENLDKDGWLVIKPKKTARSAGTTVRLPLFALPPFKSIRLEKSGPLLVTVTGRPWCELNVTRRWTKALIRVGMADRTFHDIRRTTGTRLIEAGCTEAERGVIMGHAVAQGSGMAYVARTKEMALNAYGKWARRMEGAEIVPLVKRDKRA